MASETQANLSLARRYRPQMFKELIGQDILRQTLQNAIAHNRVAGAYMLSGVRGVGKTTTARIIAKILNCINRKDDDSEPCLTCDNCTAIAQNSFLDIMEIDAASHTGVDDVRNIIDQAHYKPTQGSFRIFILDEVHMLSKSAFNALLKTLEEPPSHVIFIFATTEIRKVPPTILSRCQRFDLRRVTVGELKNHFMGVAQKEGYDLGDDGAYILARAADGSVRDGLSMLDQALSLSNDKNIEASQITTMLGQSDKNQLWDLFYHIVAGAQSDSLKLFHHLIAHGAEARYIIEQLADITHHLTISKIANHPHKNDKGDIPEQYKDLAADLKMSVLARLWQFLSKAHQEISYAHDPIMAGEMALIRVLLIGDYPSPEDFFNTQNSPSTTNTAPSNTPANHSPASGATQHTEQHTNNSADDPSAKKKTIIANHTQEEAPNSADAPLNAQTVIMAETAIAETAIETTVAIPAITETPAAALNEPLANNDSMGEIADALPAITHPSYKKFQAPQDIIDIVLQKQHFTLSSELQNTIIWGDIDNEAQKVTINETENSASNTISHFKQFMRDYTDDEWQVIVNRQLKGLTLKAQKQQAQQEKMQQLYNKENVKKILSFFPDATIISHERTI